MAYITEVTYTQTGDTNKAFKITFPFLETTDVSIEVNEVGKTITTHYTISGTTVTFEDGVLSGGSTENKIRLFRQTDLSSTDPTFQTGSSIRAQDLNKLKNRLLYAAQEYGRGTGGTDIDLTTGNKNHITVNTETDWTINSNKITTAMMVDDAVTSAKILDGNVTLAKIAEAAVDEHRLNISNAGSDGNFLTKQSGNTGGLTWAAGSVAQSDRDASSGCVTFLRTSASNNSDGADTFTGYKPDGTTISTGGTTTGGLQEAINYAANNGLDFFCHGGGIANRPDDTGTAGIPHGILRPSSGSGMTNGTYTGKSLSGGSGSSLAVTVVVAGGTVTTVTITTPGSGYNNNETVTLAAGALYTDSPAFSWLVRTATDVGVIQTTTPITIPPSQNRSYHFRSCTINAVPSTIANPALIIDSGMMLDFDFRGQVVYSGTGNAVSINPTSRPPYDGLAAASGVLTDSNIRIDTVAYIGEQSGTAAGHVIMLAGAINRNNFTFGELNGSGYDSEVGAVTPFALNGLHLTNSEVNYNIIKVTGVHDTANSGIQVGTTSSGVQPKGNHFTIGEVSMNAASFNAVDSFGQYNLYDFYAAGSYTHAFKAQSTSKFERVNIRRADGNSGANIVHGPNFFDNSYWDGDTGQNIPPNLLIGTLTGGAFKAKINVQGDAVEDVRCLDLVSAQSDREVLFIHSSDGTSYVGNHIKIQCDRGPSGASTPHDLCQFDAGGDQKFHVRANGDVNAEGTFTNNNADYAEYFESSTGSVIAVGTTVVLDNEKIRAATGSDSTDNIIGVIRPVDGSSVIGNSAWNNWNNKYLKDDFGQEQLETYTVTEWDETKTDSQGDEYTVNHSYATDRIPSDLTVPSDAAVTTKDSKGNLYQRLKLNPSWDKTKTYVPRSERDEWCVVGLLGQVEITKGQPTGSKWLKLKNVSSTVERWLVR